MKKEVLKIIPKPVKWIFFWIGVIATLAYRIIILLNFYSPYWVKVSWYIGTLGFVLYFGYLFIVQAKEVRIIKENNLLPIVEKLKMDKRQKKALMYVVESNMNSKEKWNSMFIFLLSLIALIIGILLDSGIVGSLN